MVHAPIAGHVMGCAAVIIGSLAVHPVRGEITPTAGRPKLVVPPPRQVEYLLSGARDRRRRRGKLALVLIIDLDRRAQNADRFTARPPGEIGIHQQRVIVHQGGEIMAIGIAVALGIHHGGIGGADRAIAVLIGNVVVQGIDHFAGGNAVDIVPEKTVIDGALLRARREEIVAPAQQSQVLLQQRGFLPLETKERGGNSAIGFVGGAKSNGWIGRVSPSLVANHHIEIVDVTGSQQQRVVGRAVVDGRIRIDAESLAAVEHGLIDFNQTQFVDRIHIERNIAFPAGASLADDAGGGVGRIVKQVLGALIEGVDALQHPLDPALGQYGFGPIRPVGDGRIGQWIDAAVAHGDVVVAQRLDARSTQGVVSNVITIDQMRPSVLVVGSRFRWGLAIRSLDPPVVFVIA